VHLGIVRESGPKQYITPVGFCLFNSLLQFVYLAFAQLENSEANLLNL
jgi:hypothetical protein